MSNLLIEWSGFGTSSGGPRDVVAMRALNAVVITLWRAVEGEPLPVTAAWFVLGALIGGACLGLLGAIGAAVALTLGLQSALH